MKLSKDEIITFIKKELPKIIKEHPEVRMAIEEIVEKTAATKDDIKAILLELKKMREEYEKRFEEINRRFEKVDKRFEEVNKRFEEVITRMDKGFKLLRDAISAMGSRWGMGAEEAFRKGFEDVLSELGYKVIKWRKKDEKAEVFMFPRDAEIDIIIRDDKKIAIEVKSSLTLGELENFLKCTKFYEKVENEKLTDKIIVAIFTYPEVFEYASKLGVKIIRGLEEASDYFK